LISSIPSRTDASVTLTPVLMSGGAPVTAARDAGDSPLLDAVRADEEIGLEGQKPTTR